MFSSEFSDICILICMGVALWEYYKISTKNYATNFCCDLKLNAEYLVLNMFNISIKIIICLIILKLIVEFGEIPLVKKFIVLPRVINIFLQDFSNLFQIITFTIASARLFQQLIYVLTLAYKLLLGDKIRTNYILDKVLTNKQKVVIILAVLLAMLSFGYISNFFNYLHNSTTEYSLIVSMMMNYIGYIIVELYRETVGNIFNFCSTFLNS